VPLSLDYYLDAGFGIQAARWLDWMRGLLLYLFSGVTYPLVLGFVPFNHGKDAWLSFVLPSEFFSACDSHMVARVKEKYHDSCVYIFQNEIDPIVDYKDTYEKITCCFERLIVPTCSSRAIDENLSWGQSVTPTHETNKAKVPFGLEASAGWDEKGDQSHRFLYLIWTEQIFG